MPTQDQNVPIKIIVTEDINQVIRCRSIVGVRRSSYAIITVVRPAHSECLLSCLSEPPGSLLAGL